MILEQHYLACLAQASYLIGDHPGGTAIIVDPRRDIEVYLEAAARHRLTIRHVLLTHFHADFLAGHLELQARTGAEIGLGAAADPAYPHRKFADGDVLALDGVRVVARATPGHTPESTCYLVYDDAKDPRRPHAVLTGDTLFVGDVGRPDLMASVGHKASDLAGSLYDSLHDTLLALPDATIVYPGHGAGSLCGRSLGSSNQSTIGDERQRNYALKPMTKARFIELVTTDQPIAPAYFGFDAELNRSKHDTLETTLARALVALDLSQVDAKLAAGAIVLDTRSQDAFAAGHLRNSLNISLSGKFAAYAGALIEPGRAIVVVADAGAERESVLRLGRIGFDSVVGYLPDIAGVLAAHPKRAARTVRRTPAELAAARGAGRGPKVLDVRSPSEWQAGHIEGSVNIPVEALGQRLAEVPADRPLLVHCKSGYRSSVAVSFLMARGVTGLEDLQGGFDAWAAAGQPVATCAPVGA